VSRPGPSRRSHASLRSATAWRARRSCVDAAMTAQVHRSACSGAAPRRHPPQRLLQKRRVCSTSKRRTYARQTTSRSGRPGPAHHRHSTLTGPLGLGNRLTCTQMTVPGTPAEPRPRPTATSAQLGMQPRPRLHDHLPVPVVGGGQRGNRGRPGRRVLAGEPLSVLARPAGGARRPLGRVGGEHPVRPDADQHRRPQLGEVDGERDRVGAGVEHQQRDLRGSTKPAEQRRDLCDGRGGRIRRASTGAVHESWSQPSWQAHWSHQPATTGWPAECREGW